MTGPLQSFQEHEVDGVCVEEQDAHSFIPQRHGFSLAQIKLHCSLCRPNEIGRKQRNTKGQGQARKPREAFGEEVGTMVAC